jgi:hypothetical protein
LSRKILQIGQELVDEDAAEHRATIKTTGTKENSAFDFESRFEGDEALSDDERFPDEQWGDEEEIEEVVCFWACSPKSCLCFIVNIPSRRLIQMILTCSTNSFPAATKILYSILANKQPMVGAQI